MFGPISIMGDLVPGNSLIGRTNGAVPYHDLKKGSETYEQWENRIEQLFKDSIK